MFEDYGNETKRIEYYINFVHKAMAGFETIPILTPCFDLIKILSN